MKNHKTKNRTGLIQSPTHTCVCVVRACQVSGLQRAAACCAASIPLTALHTLVWVGGGQPTAIKYNDFTKKKRIKAF